MKNKLRIMAQNEELSCLFQEELNNENPQKRKLFKNYFREKYSRFSVLLKWEAIDSFGLGDAIDSFLREIPRFHEFQHELAVAINPLDFPFLILYPLNTIVIDKELPRGHIIMCRYQIRYGGFDYEFIDNAENGISRMFVDITHLAYF